MGDDLFGYGLDMSDPVFRGANDAKYNVSRPGVDVLLKPGDTAVHRAQHAVITHDVDEVATVKVLPAQLFGGNVDGLFLREVDRYI